MATPYPRALRDFPRLRQSQLAIFADCQLSAGFGLRVSIRPRRRRGEHSDLATSGWTTHRASAGRIAHATVARSLHHMLERRQERIPPEVVIDLYEEVIRQADVPLAETFALPAHEDRQLRRTLRKWARDTVFTIEDVVGVEERFEAVVSYPDGAGGMVDRVLTGQLDLLLISDGGAGEHATVADWKDTWKLPPKRHDEDAEEDDGEDDKLSLEGYFQQRFYALLVFVAFPRVQSVTLREFYLRRSQQREATLWRYELPEIVSYLAAEAEKFDRCYHAATEPAKGRRVRRVPLATPAQWGEPSPGAHCGYCPLAVECPIEPDARGVGRIESPEHAAKIAGELVKARSVVSQLGAALSAWTDRWGPTRVKDAKRERFFGHVEGVRTERPTLRQLEQAMLAGRDPRTLYRSKVHTRFTDYSPQEDVTHGLDDEDVVEMFERAAQAAKRSRKAAA